MNNKLKVQRAIHSLTQEQLAQKMGVTRQTIIAIEANQYLPSLGLAFKLARFFNMTIEEIFIYERKNYEN